MWIRAALAQEGKMKCSPYVFYGAIFVLGALLSGCATIEGISVNYAVQKEQFVDPKAKVFISLADGRVDKNIIGDGAKETVATRTARYVVFTVLYPEMPHQSPLKDQEEPIQVFKTALTERLSKNGISVVNVEDKEGLVLDLIVKQFRIDFDVVDWIGEVGYTARVKKKGETICQDDVYEAAKSSIRLYGFHSGEKALSEAFGKAIDKLDINGCFSKLQKK
jgi:hypothetical protein